MMNKDFLCKLREEGKLELSDPIKSLTSMEMLYSMGYVFNGAEWVKSIEPRTKVVYEPLQCVHKWQLVKAVEDGDNGGEQIYVKASDEYDHATPSHAVDSFCTLYRKVEKEIDWRVDANEFFYKTKFLGNDHTFGQALTDKDLSNELIELCHLVASLTDKPE